MTNLVAAWHTRQRLRKRIAAVKRGELWAILATFDEMAREYDEFKRLNPNAKD